jgi:hypothetical protein
VCAVLVTIARLLTSVRAGTTHRLSGPLLKRLGERNFAAAQLTMAKHVVELFKTSARDIGRDFGPSALEGGA